MVLCRQVPFCMKMEGKVVVITGATSGIGQVTAEGLAAEGARIVQVARDRVRGEAALGRYRASSIPSTTPIFRSLTK